MKDTVETFQVPKYVGPYVAFDKKHQIVKIGNKYFDYDEIKYYTYNEKNEKCKRLGNKAGIAGIAFALLPGFLRIFRGFEVFFADEADETIELKFIFKQKNKEVYILDLLENNNDRIIEGDVNYNYFKNIKKDLVDSFDIMLKVNSWQRAVF